MPYYDDEATDRAAKAYFRMHKRSGHTAMIPNRSDSGREGEVVTLRSGERELARYRVRPDGRLRRLKVAAL